MLTIRRLLWDPQNVAHIAHHQVTIEEVEQVCHNGPLVRHGYLDRLILIGPTLAGRVLAIVLEHTGEETYYVVTARSADRKERRLYEESRGANQG